MSALRFGRSIALIFSFFLVGCGEENPSSPDAGEADGSIAVKTVRAFSLGGRTAEAGRTGINGDIGDEVYAGPRPQDGEPA